MNNERPFYLLYVLVFLLVVLFFVVSGAEAEEICVESSFSYTRMSPSMIEHYGLDYRDETHYVVMLPYDRNWYLVTHVLVEIPCAEIDVSNTPDLPETTGIECLGIPWEGAGTFTVDGLEYPYDNHLSFIVPVDAIWRWELFIDGQKILVFEQTEPGNCRIVS